MISNGHPVHRLTQEKFFLVVEKLRTLRERIEAERPDMDQLADELSAALGFRVERRSIGRARRLIGLSWVAKRRPRQRKADLHDLVLKAHGEAIVSLYTQLGLPLPEWARPEKEEPRSC